MVTTALGQALREIQNKDIVPKLFVLTFIGTNPEFTPFGQQFDSDEFMQKLLTNISSCSQDHANLIRKLFEIDYTETLTNVEDEKDTQQNFTSSTKLCCSLGGTGKDVKVGTILEGIKLVNLQLILEYGRIIGEELENP